LPEQVVPGAAKAVKGEAAVDARRLQSPPERLSE